MTDLIPVGLHECVTCSRCACTFAAVHPACPACCERERNSLYHFLRRVLLREPSASELRHWLEEGEPVEIRSGRPDSDDPRTSSGTGLAQVVRAMGKLNFNAGDGVRLTAEETAALAHATRTRPDYDLRCQDCGAAHNLDTSIPSAIWNQIAQDVGVLCTLCIDDRLHAAGLTAEAEFYFVGQALTSKLYANDEGSTR